MVWRSKAQKQQNIGFIVILMVWRSKTMKKLWFYCCVDGLEVENIETPVVLLLFWWFGGRTQQKHARLIFILKYRGPTFLNFPLKTLRVKGNITT